MSDNRVLDFNNAILDLFIEFDIIDSLHPLSRDNIESVLLNSNKFKFTSVTLNNKIYEIDEETELKFAEKLLKILQDFECIGKQSHIQKLYIYIKSDELPIIKLEEIIV